VSSPTRVFGAMSFSFISFWDEPDLVPVSFLTLNLIKMAPKRMNFPSSHAVFATDKTSCKLFKRKDPHSAFHHHNHIVFRQPCRFTSLHTCAWGNFNQKLISLQTKWRTKVTARSLGDLDIISLWSCLISAPWTWAGRVVFDRQLHLYAIRGDQSL
jgi:hypothetical protein